MTIDSTTKYDQLPQFLTIQEFQRVVRIGRSTAYELVRSGEIESTRFGGVVRIPRRALKAFGMQAAEQVAAP